LKFGVLQGVSEVVGALQGDSHGVRADKALSLQSKEEGAYVDLVEWSEPRRDITISKFGTTRVSTEEVVA
jgi:hypothetical protein